MISIAYTQQANTVDVLGINSSNPSDVLTGTYTFASEVEAKGFMLLIEAIQAAVEVSYVEQSAVFIDDNDKNIVVVTTFPIPNKAKEEIAERLQMLVDLDPLTIRGYRFEPFLD